MKSTTGPKAILSITLARHPPASSVRPTTTRRPEQISMMITVEISAIGIAQISGDFEL